VESSLQYILSNSLLWKWNKLLVVIRMWSWRGKFAASARAWLANLQPALGHGCGKQTPSDSILFFRTNLLYVLNVEMYREVWFRSAHDFGTLIERNPPPRGGVLLTMFPDQELYDEMQRSYLVVESLTHGSWSGNIVNRKPPRGGGYRDSARLLGESYADKKWGATSEKNCTEIEI